MESSKETLPLTEAELDRLEELLDSDLFQGRAMLLDELQGFCCGIASGPDPVAPSEWLPIALGEAPQYRSQDDETEVVQLVLRFYAETATALDEGRMPELILYPVDEDGDAYDYAPWADAYLLGTDIGPRPWLEAADDYAEELAELLEPFFLLNGALEEDMRKAGEAWLSAAEEARARSAAEAELPSLVLTIRDFWKAKAGAGTFVRDSEKVRRNEPCPCGSGRKFKYCCGDPKRLH